MGMMWFMGIIDMMTFWDSYGSSSFGVVRAAGDSWPTLVRSWKSGWMSLVQTVPYKSAWSCQIILNREAFENWCWTNWSCIQFIFNSHQIAVQSHSCHCSISSKLFIDHRFWVGPGQNQRRPTSFQGQTCLPTQFQESEGTPLEPNMHFFKASMLGSKIMKDHIRQVHSG